MCRPMLLFPRLQQPGMRSVNLSRSADPIAIWWVDIIGCAAALSVLCYASAAAHCRNLQQHAFRSLRCAGASLSHFLLHAILLPTDIFKLARVGAGAHARGAGCGSFSR